jgi:(methylthio)acryloyl-CoA hydratase
MNRKRLSIDLPASLTAERLEDIAVLRLSRPQKRNALDDTTVNGIEVFLAELPEDIRAIVLHGEGDHFSAGLDLSELTVRNTVEAVHHSRNWHRIFDKLEFGKVPVVAVLHGAVVGGGLELAAACHIRVAERSAYPAPDRRGPYDGYDAYGTHLWRRRGPHHGRLAISGRRWSRP